MPCFKSIIFYQNCPKIKLFLKKKCKIFKPWGLRSQTPVPPAAGVSAPRPPKQSPQLRICGYVPATLCTVNSHTGFRSFCGFDFILLHYAKLFIRQSIDREQIFDVTFENPPLKNPAYATGCKS